MLHISLRSGILATRNAENLQPSGYSHFRGYSTSFFFNRLIAYTGTSIPLACSGRRVAVKEFIGPPRWPQLNLRSRLAR